MDEKFLYLINQKWTSPALDFFMVLLSSLSIWMPVFILLILAMLVFGGFRERALIGCAVFIIAAGDGLINQSLKDLIARPRPEKIVENVRMLDFAKAKPRILAVAKPIRVKYSRPKPGPKSGRSFPSGHVINSFGIATLFALFYRFGWLLYLPASGVAYSRIYVGSHWPSDVLVSLFIGTGLAMLIIALLESLWRHFGKRLLPTVFANHPELRKPNPTA